MTAPREPLAVVGIDGLFPGSTDAGGFWRDLLDGRDQLRDVPPTHWLIDDYYDPDPKAPDKTYAKRGAFLETVELDPLAWGIPPSTVPATDSSQLLALIVAQRVLADATGGQFDELDRSRVSVILGVTGGQELLGSMVARLQRPVWRKALLEAGIGEEEVERGIERILDHYVPWQESTFPGLLGNVVAGRIANRLDLGGTNCITDAACASSMSALSMAANELHLGDSDLVITGGVDTMNDVFMYMCFSKTPALSPSGDCRPFSDAADGTMLGEGIGMLALKRLADAERDGDRIYALVRGIGSSSDGRAKSVYAPLASGQARALRRAYERAGHGPDSVELVEAHGTGTKAGDVAEFEALRTVFAESGREDRQWCALGSVKSLVGHTKAAAGAAGLFKAILAVRHRALPPMVKVERPNPKLDFADSAFYLNTRARPWVRGSDHERRAAVSSFGFGGSNFHVTIGDYTGEAARAPRFRTLDTELVVLCGEPADVARSAREHAERSGEAGYLRWLSRSSLAEYQAGAAARLAIVATGDDDLAAKLDAAEERIAAGGAEPFEAPGVRYGTGTPAGRDEIAFLFPGQGSQYLHMGAVLAIAFDAAIGAWDLAADLDLGGRLHDVVYPPAAFADDEREAHAARLTSTEWAQPAIACTSLAMLRLLDELGVSPARVGGHSFGEVAALHAAGAIDAATMLGVARRRGELMRDAAERPGAMLAVGRPLGEVRELVERAGADVVVANHNAPAQVVLSGATDAIVRLEATLEADGVAVQRLPVATAFHSPIVAGAAETFGDYLAGVELEAARIPVYANRTAAPYPDAPAGMRERLAEQLASPVRFVEMVERMYADGARTFVEVGPGSVLTTLVGKILDGRDHLAVALDRKGAAGAGPFLGGVGRLAAAGAAMDLTALWRGYREAENPHEREKPKLALRINGANQGRPYPPSPGSTPEGGGPPPGERRPPGAPGGDPPRGERHAPESNRSLAVPEPVAVSAAGPAPALNTPATHVDAASGNGVPPAASNGLAPVPPTLPAPAPATIASHAPPGDAAGALQAVHEHAGQVHAACIEAIGRLHASYLQGYEDTVARLSALAGAPGAAPPLPGVAEPAPPPPALSPPPPAAEPAAPRGPEPRPAEPAVPSVPDLPRSTVAAADLTGLLLEVVSAKTGYPAEMLTMEMELEGDLGIDSIKRVEILAGMRDRVPQLPEVDPAELAELATLGQIADYMAGHGAVDDGVVAEDGGAPARSPVTLGRHALALGESPPTGLALPGLLDGLIAVTDDGTGVAPALVEELGTRGVHAAVVRAVPPDAAGVVLCDGLAESPTTAVDARERSLAAFRAAKAVAPRFAEQGGLLVTLQDTGGRFSLDGVDPARAWLGGIAGLARTAAREWPAAAVKAIDVERGDRHAAAIARAVADELTGGGPAPEVGLRADGTRLTLTDEPAGAEPGDQPLTPADVIVVSGGARGVTAACVVELARATAARFVLCGRTELLDEPAGCEAVEGDGAIKRFLLEAAEEAGQSLAPAEMGRRAAQIQAAREIRATLAAIEEAGGQARYVPVDVTDAAALSEALESVRAEWGAITGVVHGAGVLADKLIADKTEEQFTRVFSTKVDGLAALLETTAGDPLKVLCAFSSVAARAGNAGQADYAMANETLNKVAEAERIRRNGSCVVKAIGWGPWDGGMVSPELRAHFALKGVELIPVEAGARAFVDELASGRADQVEVTIGAAAGAGGLLGPGAPPVRRTAVLVSPRSHPHLAGHAIRGSVVVPVAYAVDWMGRAARAFWPARELAAIEEVKVLTGIPLPGFASGAAFALTIAATELEGEAAELELAGPDGSAAYRSRAVFAPRSKLELEEPALERFPGAVPYGGRSLFHGPEFQVVTEIGGIGERGISGVLRCAREMEWPEDRWLIDPAALDGILQLSVLWIDQALDAPALPTGLGSVRLRAPVPAAGPLECTIAVRDATGLRATGDAVIRDVDGNTILEVAGLEAHVLPHESG